MRRWTIGLVSVLALLLTVTWLVAQPAGGKAPTGDRPPRDQGPAAGEGQENPPPPPDHADGGQGGPGRRPPPPGMVLMVALDSNHDGELSAEEIANASKSLLKLDTNGDGKLSRDEMMPPPRKKDGGGKAPTGDRPPRDQADGGEGGPGHRPPGEGAPRGAAQDQAQ